MQRKSLMHVKVCGLGSIEQVDWAIELGYDAIGVVVTPRSKRYCPPDAALTIAQYAQGKIETFAVAYSIEEIGELYDCFDTIQLYTPAPINNLAYSSGTQPPESLACKYFFYDASIGSGIYKAIPSWVNSVRHRLYIAGGLNEENVSEVISAFHPYGVDVSSAVETAPLMKSKNKMARFIKAVRDSNQP
jgi:phosphoribosylanthranilate isomerase